MSNSKIPKITFVEFREFLIDIIEDTFDVDVPFEIGHMLSEACYVNPQRLFQWEQIQTDAIMEVTKTTRVTARLLLQRNEWIFEHALEAHRNPKEWAEKKQKRDKKRQEEKQKATKLQAESRIVEVFHDFRDALVDTIEDEYYLEVPLEVGHLITAFCFEQDSRDVFQWEMIHTVAFVEVTGLTKIQARLYLQGANWVFSTALEAYRTSLNPKKKRQPHSEQLQQQASDAYQAYRNVKTSGGDAEPGAKKRSAAGSGELLSSTTPPRMSIIQKVELPGPRGKRDNRFHVQLKTKWTDWLKLEWDTPGYTFGNMVNVESHDFSTKTSSTFYIKTVTSSEDMCFWVKTAHPIKLPIVTLEHACPEKQGWFTKLTRMLF